MKNKKSIGIIFIYAVGILFGILGSYVFYSGMKYVLGFYDILVEVSNIQAFRARNSFQGYINIIWALPFLSMLPMSIGMFMRKEWARRFTPRLMSLAIFVSFPFFLLNFSSITETVFTKFGLDQKLSEQSFVYLMIRALSPWIIFLLLLFLISYTLRKYLSNPNVKEQFK